jgi:hypothetical protein
MGRNSSPPSLPVEAPALSTRTVGQMSVVLERRHAELPIVAIRVVGIAREPQAGVQFVIFASLCGLSSGGPLADRRNMIIHSVLKTYSVMAHPSTCYNRDIHF